MKRLIFLLPLFAALSALGQFGNLTCSNLVNLGPTRNAPPYNVGSVSNVLTPGSMTILDTVSPRLYFYETSYTNSPPYPYGGGGIIWHAGQFTFTSPAQSITYLTNVYWVTNSFIASNTPDGNPIPWLAGTNVWTGTNTFTNTVRLNGPVIVNGSTGGSSNVSLGGVTLVFINGFYIGSH